MDFGAVGVTSLPVLSVVEMGQRQETVLVTILHQMGGKLVVEMVLKPLIAMLETVQVRLCWVTDI